MGSWEILYWSLNVTGVIQSRGMGQMQHIGARRNKNFSKKTQSKEITWETQEGWKNNVKMEHLAPSRD
jgi:hypothetical protein